jgi:hypothetical protein
MKQPLLLLVACLIAMALTSCEGYRHVRGVVLDGKTKLPLDSVLCQAVNPHQMQEGPFSSAYTDRRGAFEVTGPFGGCMSECPDITVRLSKQGYKTLQLLNPADTTFYLVRTSK